MPWSLRSLWIKYNASLWIKYSALLLFFRVLSFQVAGFVVHHFSARVSSLSSTSQHWSCFFTSGCFLAIQYIKFCLVHKAMDRLPGSWYSASARGSVCPRTSRRCTYCLRSKMEYSLLKDVTQESHRWRVRVRVTRMNEYTDADTKNKILRLNFVLLDEEGLTVCKKSTNTEK